MEVIKQMERVEVLTEMMTDEMNTMKIQIEKLKVWEADQNRRYSNKPNVNKAQLQRIMMMLRKETIKLERMLGGI